MHQLGHTDPKLALRIYARAMRRDEAELERLRALIGCSEWAPMGTSERIKASRLKDGGPVSRSRMPVEGA